MYLNSVQHLAYVGIPGVRDGNTEPNVEFFQLDQDLGVGVDYRQTAGVAVAPPRLAVELVVLSDKINT